MDIHIFIHYINDCVNDDNNDDEIALKWNPINTVTENMTSNRFKLSHV